MSVAVGVCLLGQWHQWESPWRWTHLHSVCRSAVWRQNERCSMDVVGVPSRAWYDRVR